MIKLQTVLMGVVVTLGLAGCSTSVVSSNPRSVVVESQALDAAEAQHLADTECQKHHRYAQMTIQGGYWDRHFTFACVE
ncbi:hypothetical protein D3C81_2038940 [compost metagenome]